MWLFGDLLRINSCVFIFRDIIRSAVNASDNDCVIFAGSGCTGAVHKLIHALELRYASSPLVSNLTFY